MKIIKNLCKISLLFIILIFIFYIGIHLYAKYYTNIDISNIKGNYIYDKDNNPIKDYTTNYIKLEDISPNLINSTLLIEDKRFYKHDGFDYLRIIKALLKNIKYGKNIEGASTITQQYAKNLFLEFDKTWKRKIKEAWLTIQIETHYSKDEILEGYLNTINYGGIYGIENASQYYFGKSAKDLTLSESTILAGIPKSPSNYSPITNLDNAKKRQKIILDIMQKNNYITKNENINAYNEELTYIGKLKTNNSSTLMYYEDAVNSELKKLVSENYLKEGNLKIYTNLDLNLQLDIENNINKYITNEKLQVSIVASDPNTGKIYALVGGKDYSKSQYNRALSSKRQVGSTFKPFLYYAAIENGFTPSTTFNSTKTTFVFSGNKTYSPNNFGNIYANKEISLATALAYSDNIFAVKTHLFLGEDTLVNTLKRVGIKSKLESIPSLALGTSNINILEMITAYSSLANNGYKISPHVIEKIEDKNGNVIYEYNEAKEPILSQSIVFIINELLSNCYSSNFIDYSYPTCINIANKLTHKYAIKTGTTDSDSLVFGYNKDIIMGIWAGYDDNSNTPSNTGTLIKNIWADTIESYFKDKETTWYDMPSNVVGAIVDPISGKLASNNTKKAMLYYIKGTEPYSETNKLDDLIPTIKEEE